MNGEWHYSLSPLGIIFLFIRARSGFALANSAFAFERTTVFRCGVATEGITSFEAGCFRLLQGRLRIAGSLSRRPPSFDAVSLPRELPSFEAECLRLLQGRLRVAGSLSRGLPSLVSPSGDHRLSK